MEDPPIHTAWIHLTLPETHIKSPLKMDAWKTRPAILKIGPAYFHVSFGEGKLGTQLLGGSKLIANVAGNLEGFPCKHRALFGLVFFYE